MKFGVPVQVLLLLFRVLFEVHVTVRGQLSEIGGRVGAAWGVLFGGAGV